MQLLNVTLSTQMTNVLTILESRIKSEYSPVRMGRDPMIQAEHIMQLLQVCYHLDFTLQVYNEVPGICSCGQNEPLHLCS